MPRRPYSDQSGFAIIKGQVRQPDEPQSQGYDQCPQEEIKMQMGLFGLIHKIIGGYFILN